jgi:hypothetical protein
MAADPQWKQRMETLRGIIDGLEPDELVAIRWMAERRANEVYVQPARVINTTKLTGRLLDFAEDMNRDGMHKFLRGHHGYAAFVPLTAAARDTEFQTAMTTIVAGASPPTNQE